MNETVKAITDVLDPKIKGYKEELSSEFDRINKENAAIIAQMNEDSAKKGESLIELKQNVDRLLADSGKVKSTITADYKSSWKNSDHLKAAVIDIVSENHDKIKSETAFMQMKDVATMTLGNNLTGTSQISYVQNPIMRSFYNPHLYDVFRIIPTSTGNVTFPRGKSPVGEGSFGAQSEGNDKAQIDYDVEMVNTSVPFIAGYVKVSRQMLQDLPFLQSYLSQSLVEDWNRSVNTRFLNNIATNSTALSTSETITVAKMISGLAQHGNLGLGMANLILTTWDAWSKVLLTKPSDYSVPASVAIDASGSVRINGVPVVPHSQVTGSRFYVMNTDAFAIAQASGFQVRSTEFDQSDFIKNLVTYRAEARIELLSFQPTAAVYGTTGT
jgi:HK97 family phage major capsid protein